MFISYSDFEAIIASSNCYSDIWFYPSQSNVDEFPPDFVFVEKIERAFSAYGLEDFQDYMNEQAVNP